MFPPEQPADLPPDTYAPVPLPKAHQIKLLAPPLLAMLLAGLSMLGPFSIDAYLPAFPNIEADLHASAIEVQQTLSAYMLAFSGMVLWHGALSDSFGRRNLILISLVLFALGTFGCAASHSVHYLWIFRILQGMSAGAGTVVGRAIIRDLYSGPEAARLLSLVTMIFSISPAIAPIMGGWIVKLSDWRTIFLALLGYTALLFFMCWRHLPETLAPEKRQPFNPAYLASSFGSIFRSPLFHLKSGIVAFNFAGLFLYVTGAPVLLPVHLHLGPDQFGWLFVPSVLGIFLGALTANRLAGRISFGRQIGIGFCLIIGAGVFNVGYHLAFAPALPWTVAPVFFFTFGMSIVGPAATLMTLDLFPHIRGTVASCQSFQMTLLGAIVAGVIAPFLSYSVLWMALGQLGFGLIALSLWLASRAYRRSMAATARL
jgi:DHA1 family bicyclomycin/chloramphenicol resistance-like MFS transporter